MTAGRLIAVVGPSGMCKDSIMTAMAARDPGLQLVRRVITRAPELGGEDYDSVTVPTFRKVAADGAFCVHWRAHDLHYGIPMQILSDVRDGGCVLANFSRKALRRAAEVFPTVKVLNITATPNVISARLMARGRETTDEVAARLAVAQKPLPKGFDVATISNDGPLEEAVAAALKAIQPVRG